MAIIIICLYSYGYIKLCIHYLYFSSNN